MSVLANQPRKTPSMKTPSGRIARFGVPVPPRIQQFLDGPEVTQYAGVKAWGLPGWAADTKMKVVWASKLLEDINEYANDGDHYDTGVKYLPLARVGEEWNMFAVDVSDEALPVYYFESDSGFSRWAASFDEFLKKLLKKGDKTPAERLEHAYEQAGELNEAKRHADVIALLEPVLAQFPITDERRSLDDTSDTLGAAHNLVGIAYENLGDISRAIATYEIAYKLGAESAALNVCDLWLNHFKDYGRLVEYAEALRKTIWSWSNAYAWFHVRNYLGQAYLLTKQPALAVRAYHELLEHFRNEEPAKVTQAIEELRALIAERPETDRATAETILAWLDTPAAELPAEQLAVMKTWWTTLPEAVTTAITEAIKLEGDPSDADYARIANLTALEIEDAELEDLAWVTMLDKLEELDLENNDIVDLTPLASLPRLRDLDISENQVESLRPLAPCVRLERLSIGENELAGLEGLEGMKRLSYFHANEAELTSLEPLRRLPELVEVTIYQNDIEDISPLSESPRIKEISSFTNPISKGFPSLALLPWLESVDAGDDTPDEDVRALQVARPLVKIDHWYPDDDDDEAEPPPDPELPAIREWWQALSSEWRAILDSDERGKPDPSDDALLELVRKDSLHVDDNRLTDLLPLQRFTRLDYLNLGNTGTTDLTAVATLPRLRDLLIRDNPLRTLAPLVAAKFLEEIYVERCKLASLAGLERCALLRELHAEDNLVEDLAPLAALIELRELDFENNRLRSIAVLGKLPRLHTLKLGLNQIADVAPLAGCKELRSIEIWANPGIVGALALADLPELTRIISHGSLPASEIAELRRRRPDVRVD